MINKESYPPQNMVTRITRYVDSIGAVRFSLHFSVNDKAFDIDVLPSHTMEQIFNLRENAIACGLTELEG
jgi:hypothetical protein